MPRMSRRLAAMAISLILLAQLTMVAGEQAPRSRGLPDFTFVAQSNRTVPEKPIFGDDVWFFITVKNIGDADYEGSYVIGFWLCWTGNPETSVGLTPVENDADMRDLGAGASVEVNIVFKTLAVGPGNHTISVVVDDENLIEESDEGNNQANISYPISPPDPIDVSIPPGGISVDPPMPIAGDDITVNATLLNSGPGLARFADLFLYLNDTEHAISTRELLTNISPSGQMTVSANYSTRGIVPGNYKILAFIHPAWSVDWMAPDTDPSNNNATFSFSLAGPQLQLRLDHFNISPSSPRVGDMLEVLAAITNLGTGKWTQVTVDIFLDDTLVLRRPVELLEGRSSPVNLTLDTTDLAELDHTLRLVAPGLEEQLNFILAVPRPDIAVQDILWVPVLPASGDSVTLRVKVSNLGEIASPECGLAIFAAQASSMQVASARLPAMRPGHYVWQELSWNTSNATPGTYAVRAVADPDSAVAEAKEGNNALVRYMELTGPLDLALENLSIAPSAPRQGDTVVFLVGVRNMGPARLGYANITLRVAGRVVDTEPVGPIPAGGSVNSTILEWDSAGFASGNYGYELSAEAGDGPGDSFPDNNRMSGIVAILAPAPRPDIAVGGIYGSYRTVRAGAVLAFEVAVENIGTGDANGSAMAVSLENTSGKSLLYTSVPLPPLPAGKSARVNASLDTSAIAAGNYMVDIALDQPNAISELDETNNRLSWNLTLLGAAAAAPKLWVTSVRVDGVLENGRTVTVVAEVSNRGDDDLTGVFVEFFADGKAADTRTLDIVSGHGARNCSMKWTAAAGQHTLKVAVSVSEEYGVAGQLPVTVRYGAADDARQAGGFALGTALMLMALAAVFIIVRRPKRPPAGRMPRTEEE